MPPITRKALADDVVANARLIPNITVFKGRIDSTPPTISPNDLRVRPYILATMMAGRPGIDQRLAGNDTGLAWGFQLTCVVGIPDNLDQLVDAISARFELWRPPAGDSRALTRARQVNDPPSAQEDAAETPARFWTALIYQLQRTN